MANTADTAYDELYVYTMGRGRDTFILQHVVDANIAQRCPSTTNAIGAVFALVGLYLHVEKQFSGLQVQQAHKKLGARKRQWPTVSLPDDRGAMTAVDVMAVAAGDKRDAAIDVWCRSVWTACNGARETIVELLTEYGIS